MAAEFGEPRRVGQAQARRAVGQFGLTRAILATICFACAVPAGAGVIQAGESGTRVVLASAALAGFLLLGARALCLGYFAVPQGLVVVGMVTTRVIPWQHIQRIEAIPHRFTSRSDPYPADLIWVAQIDYGPCHCCPLFTIRGRAGAHRLAASLVAEVRSRQ
jgi:hypothetical protein